MTGDKIVIDLWREGKKEEARKEALKFLDSKEEIEEKDFQRLYYNFSQLQFPSYNVAIFASSILKDKLDPSNPLEEYDEALINLVNSLVKKGHHVVVYGPFKDKTKMSLSGSNPRYVNINDLSLMNEEYETGLIWRKGDIETISQCCKSLYLMPQDNLNETITNRNLSKLKGIIFLSQTQKDMFIAKYPNFRNINSIICIHGLPSFPFLEKGEEKREEKIVWTSHYGANLLFILEQWHNIKKKHPNATLDIYGNREGVDSVSLVKIVKLLDSLKDQGVKERGYLKFDKMMIELNKALIWLHAGTNPEVFSLGYTKAKSAGCVTICPLIGYLSNANSPYPYSSLESADEKIKFTNVISHELENGSKKKVNVRTIEEEVNDLCKFIGL